MNELYGEAANTVSQSPIYTVHGQDIPQLGQNHGLLQPVHGQRTQDNM